VYELQVLVGISGEAPLEATPDNGSTPGTAVEFLLLLWNKALVLAANPGISSGCQERPSGNNAVQADLRPVTWLRHKVRSCPRGRYGGNG
jgi:hypothetical protein